LPRRVVMATTDYVLGIDVGQASDPTALALLEHDRGREPVYRLRALYRFRLGTPYTQLTQPISRRLAVSQAGFDGDLDSRMLSWGEESLRCHVETEEVPRGVVGARRSSGVGERAADRARRG